MGSVNKYLQRISNEILDLWRNIGESYRPYFRMNFQFQPNKQVPPLEGLIVEDLVEELKYLVVGFEPSLDKGSQSVNQAGENGDEGSNQEEDDSLLVVSHFWDVASCESMKEVSIVSIKQQDYNTIKTLLR